MIFTWTFNVYHVHMLHRAADVAVEDRSNSTSFTSNNIFFHYCKHLGLLAKWTRRARLELKIARECRAREARHKPIILDLSHPCRLSFLS